MGLDMYLTGTKFYSSRKRRISDGFEVEGERLSLGYWRKHPDLHGYIVNTFAGGVDECQEITLYEDEIRTIIAAIKTHQLPHTEGFFFGASSPEDDPESIAIFEKALQWLTTEEDGVSRDVVYRASW